MRAYGGQIGVKFLENGAAARYPGNTVIADLTPDNPAYSVMTRLRAALVAEGLAGDFILMPEDSYHMTVIQGVNHRRREAGYWPPALPIDAPMDWADDYVEARVNRVTPPENIHMRFHEIAENGSDFRVRLRPADADAEARLRAYRDQVAHELGFRLPGHESYTFHITLAYVLYRPEGDARARLDRFICRENAFLQTRPIFTMGRPYPAFYDDMLAFSDARIIREPEV